MAISKVQTQQVSTPRPAAPAKPKAPAAQTAQTAATGWAAGSGKSAPLKITLATIDEGPKTFEKVLLPKGFKGELKTTTVNQKDKVYDANASLELSSTTLNVTGPGGKKFTIGSDGGMAQLKTEWRSEVDAAKKAPKEEWTRLEWDSGTSISGAGTAGQLFSTMEGGSEYTGGAHPNHATALATYDARTGKQVTLDSLITPKQMNDLVNEVDRRISKMKGPDDIGADSFGMGGDKAALRDTINKNFALSTDKSGKVKIDIAWESGVHALGGLMAHVSVEAPTDAAFKKAAGIE